VPIPQGWLIISRNRVVAAVQALKLFNLAKFAEKHGGVVRFTAAGLKHGPYFTIS